jgi:nucleoside-diphosphate-sugar epimerase
MKVALTGCSGFIGSYAARALKRQGHVVRGLVRASSKRDHLAGVVDEFVVGDQSDDAKLNELVRGVDAVIHNSVNWSTRGDPIANYQSNLLGSLKLLEFTRVAGASQFIFVSSVAAVSEISDEWGGRITETHPAWPHSLYGAYKAAVEAHVKAYRHSYQMNTSAWRPAAVYGVAPQVERSQWMQIVRDVREGKPIDIAHGGKITHVQDVADALALAVGDESVAGELYTLSMATSTGSRWRRSRRS